MTDFFYGKIKGNREKKLFDIKAKDLKTAYHKFKRLMEWECGKMPSPLVIMGKKEKPKQQVQNADRNEWQRKDQEILESLFALRW
jgi:hypothetical protein